MILEAKTLVKTDKPLGYTPFNSVYVKPSIFDKKKLSEFARSVTRQVHPGSQSPLVVLRLWSPIEAFYIVCVIYMRNILHKINIMAFLRNAVILIYRHKVQ